MESSFEVVALGPLSGWQWECLWLEITPTPEESKFIIPMKRGVDATPEESDECNIKSFCAGLPSFLDRYTAGRQVVHLQVSLGGSGKFAVGKHADHGNIPNIIYSFNLFIH